MKTVEYNNVIQKVRESTFFPQVVNFAYQHLHDQYSLSHHLLVLVHDQNVQLNAIPTQTTDGTYPLVYSASDDAGNSNSCGIGVLFDITAPSCDGFEDLDVARDDGNKNYSVAVNFDINVNYDATISGVDQGPVLTPLRTTGDVYWVGYDYNATYESIWWITDQAGNNGSCPWKIIVQNPDPCVYPTCDDAPPYYTVGTCPSDISVDCGGSTDCTCGAWTAPTFKDDKFVQFITVDINGSQVEEYNNDQTSGAPQHELSVGVHYIKYTAYDMHNQSVECNFVVVHRVDFVLVINRN